MWKLIQQLIGIAPEIVEARTELKRAKIEAQTKVTSQAADNEGAWERFAADNAKSTWLDEYWTVVLSLPLTASFIPQLQPFVAQGFDALDDAPQWYIAAVGASISFAFARKHVPGFAKWLKNRSA